MKILRGLVSIVLLISIGQNTFAQIELVKDINPNGSSIGGGITAPLNTFKNELYFFAGQDGVVNTQLWKSDGTEAGTVLVKDIQAMGFALPRVLVKTNDFLYFIAYQSDKFFLFRSDGTGANTNAVLDSDGNLIEVSNLRAIDDKLFIQHRPQGELEYMLYVLDDAANTPVLLTDPATYTQISWLTTCNDKVFFTAISTADGVGNELYMSDGTVAGTKLVKDIFEGPDSGQITNLKAAGTKLFLSAENGDGKEPWISDGTESGTYQIKDINPGLADSNPIGFTGATDTKVFFRANGLLFITDGTSAGTSQILDMNGDDVFSTGGFILDGSNVFFTGTGASGRELWYSDGTETGSYLVKDLNPGTSSGIDFTYNGRIMYDSKLYFTANNGTNGLELYATDGTADGTSLVEDLNPGIADATPQDLTILNGALYFFAQNENGNELRKYELPNTDPCTGITCPIGEVCIEGNCYGPITGSVLHASTLNPLENVLVTNLNRTVQTNTSSAGSFSILAIPGDTLAFTLSGYTSDTLIMEGGATEYELTLTPIDPCTGITCPIGEVCIEGACQDNSCIGVVCELGEFCEDGECKDLCEGTICPIGQICYAGSCYNPEFTGFIYDENGDPLADVFIAQYTNGSRDTVTYTDTNGFYRLFSTASTTLRFSKDGYVPRTENFSAFTGQRINIIMPKDPCFDIVCPIGQICHYGTCYDGDQNAKITVTVLDEDDNSPINDIHLNPLGIIGNTVTTDATGNGIINISGQERKIEVSDPSGRYRRKIITPQTNNYVLSLSKNICENVTCTIGEICYAGSCFQPNSSTTFEGYIFDYDSLPLTGVLVFDLNDSSSYSNSNGYFSVSVPGNRQTLSFELSKTSYGGQRVLLTSESINEIYIAEEDLCFDMQCPEGQVCHAGTCYEEFPGEVSCEDVVCPIGEVCHGGSCYDPCVVPNFPDTCPKNLPDQCEGVVCPIGQICNAGLCFDSCVSDANCGQVIDPCENITAPPGYICLGGVVVPDCPSNTLACSNALLCEVVACPPGEPCFQCGNANTGTSLVSGQLNLENLNGGRIESNHNANIFIFLIDRNTNEKMAIAKTDAEGAFVMENIPAGEYQVRGSFRGYFLEEMLLQVGEFENIDLTFTSNNRFLEMQQSRITGIIDIENRGLKGWFPSPNEGQTFYIKNEGITEFKIFTLQGLEVSSSWTLDDTDNGTALTIKSRLAPGIYLFKWKTSQASYINTQTIFVMR